MKNTIEKIVTQKLLDMQEIERLDYKIKNETIENSNKGYEGLGILRGKKEILKININKYNLFLEAMFEDIHNW